jgi:hypothetical protein
MGWAGASYNTLFICMMFGVVGARLKPGCHGPDTTISIIFGTIFRALALIVRK